MSEQRIYSRGHGRIWHELAASKLSGNAKLCYGIMGSFGAYARASLESIAERMSLKDPKPARAAQAELTDTGWIVLLLEGAANWPRAWWMNERPFDHVNNPDVTQEMEAARAHEIHRRATEKRHPSKTAGVPESGTPRGAEKRQGCRKTAPKASKGFKTLTAVSSEVQAGHPRSRARDQRPKDQPSQTGGMPKALRDLAKKYLPAEAAQ